jgi:hypothetical protein
VAFEGESITGEDLLRAVGLSFEQFGGGARALCSLDGIGCGDPSSFDSCFCQCQSGSGSCTYWAFFVQRYGGDWRYSSMGFNLAEVRDGDLHGWKWGSGSLQSAPPPAEITFEDVCGHSPRGGVAPTPTFTATRAASTPTAAESAGVETASPETPSETPDETPGTERPASPSLGPPGSPSAERPSRTPASVTVTMVAPRNDDEGGGGGSVGAWAGFGAVAAVLVAAVLAGIAWRRRHGA